MHAQATLPIAGLRAGLVPRHEWAMRRWFYANPIWYYHLQRTAPQPWTRLRSYDLVDPELRDVCRMLNDAGLFTTPSCQGHSYRRERFERIWAELTREADAIRGDGLLVRDCQTDQPYVFRSPQWGLPWPSFADFYREAAGHQSQGYLGIVVPPSMAAIEEAFIGFPYISEFSRLAREDRLPASLPGGTVFAMTVDALDESVRASEWRRLTGYIAHVLKQTTPTARDAVRLPRVSSATPPQPLGPQPLTGGMSQNVPKCHTFWPSCRSRPAKLT